MIQDEARAEKAGGRDVCTPYQRLHIDLQRVAGALCRP
ncbi:putative leader peptide [Streptomyces sp. NRRL S-646]